jgi:integrase
LCAGSNANKREDKKVSLWKRGNVWWAFFYIDGVRHQSSTGTNNRRQAEAIEQKLKADANARRHQIIQYDPKLTVAALITRFMSDAEPRPHHLYQFKALLPFFGDVLVIRLNRNMAREFRVWKKQQKTITDATINRALSTLRHVLYWAVDEQLLQANPMARLPLVRERRLKRPVMSLSEEDRVLAVVPDYLRRIVIAALDTGMRRGEILRQRWEDVDLTRKLLLVTKSKTAEGEAREIPLTCRLLGLLSEDPKAAGIVFTYNGLPLSWIRKGWLGALKRAGLRHFRFHDLRHSFNTRLMEAGVIQDVRMALMGHSGGSKVHSIYTHVELPVKREAIARLERWVQQQRQGGQHASETADGTSYGQTSGAQALEEEDSSGSGS